MTKPDRAEMVQEARKLLAAATPTEGAVQTRYDHGGGRMYAETANRNRHLIVDCYAESDREFYFAAYRLLAALVETEPAGWQPIETAPKMRTILLFAVTDIGDNGEVRNWKMATGSWHTGYEDERSKAAGYTPWQWDGSQLKAWQIQPTHWMPLPAPPVTETKLTDRLRAALQKLREAQREWLDAPWRTSDYVEEERLAEVIDAVLAAAEAEEKTQ